MDLENLNCPQYIRFSSESFKASINNDTASSDEMDNTNQLSSPFRDSLERTDEAEQTIDSLERTNEDEQTMSSLTESQLHEEQYDEGSLSSEEEFIIQARVSRIQAAKFKKPTTIVKPFHFHTDARVKSSDLSDSNLMAKEFSSQLRQHNVYSSNVSHVTKPQPFKLTEPKVKKGEGKYLSLAEQVNAFQKKTPERFHTTSQKEYQPQEHWSPPKLRPRTPKLHAIKRSRPVDILSREEQEEKEAEEMRKYEFHARPVDPQLYKPQLIVKPIAKKATKTKEPQLQTAIRAKSEESLESAETTYKFRARPVPTNILKGPVGLGEKTKVLATVPKAPNFRSDKRLAKRKLAEQESAVMETPAKKSKKNVVKKKRTSLPKKRTSLPKIPKRPKRTEIKPFSFDRVDKERFMLKEKKIQEEIEKENKPFIFKAQLMPFNDKSVLPSVEKKSATKPQPFNFVLDKRNLNRSFMLEEENVSFKAKPATVLHKPPFIPEKSCRSFTEIEEFSLRTDRRASERLKQKGQKDAEDLENQKILEHQNALEEKRQQKEIQKLRQELVHKANPIPDYKPLEIKRSTKPVTKAKSPKFETDKRLRSRNDTFRDV